MDHFRFYDEQRISMWSLKDPSTLFSSLKTVLSQNNNQYYDECRKETFSIKRIVVVHRIAELWVSTYQDDEKIFSSRPLLIMPNRTVTLCDLPCFSLETAKMTEFVNTTAGPYSWFTMTYDDFCNNKFPFTLSGKTELGKKIEVCVVYQYEHEFTKGHKPITPCDSSHIIDSCHKELHDRILRVTGAEPLKYKDLCFLEPEIKLTLRNGKLRYYATKIRGNCGNGQEFDISIENGYFVVKKGRISFLDQALTLCEENKHCRTQLYQYEQRECRYLMWYLQKWMLAGCPDIGVEYNLRIGYGNICLWSMQKDDVKLDFIGLLAREYLKIKHSSTNRSWTFTNNPNYAHIEIPGSRMLQWVSDYHKEGENGKPAAMTDYAAIEAEKLLKPFITALKNF